MSSLIPTISEQEVESYLKELGISCLYEQAIFVQDDKNRPRVWTPDFYLPELGIYIEVCGSEKFSYDFREKIYKKNNIPIIFIHQFKPQQSWQFYLKQRIIEINLERQKIINTLK
ncbi:MAG: hypothetical protein AABW58_02265 [Nanoarchaeota archaeon]